MAQARSHTSKYDLRDAAAAKTAVAAVFVAFMRGFGIQNPNLKAVAKKRGKELFDVIWDATSRSLPSESTLRANLSKSLTKLKETINNIAQMVKDPPDESLLNAAINLTVAGMGALWDGINNMIETSTIVKKANQRLDTFISRFKKEVLKRLEKMDAQLDAIEETVKNEHLRDEAKIRDLETRFEDIYSDVYRTDNAIKRFRRDFESSMIKEEIPKLRDKENQLSKAKWWKARVGGVGALTLTVVAAGGESNLFFRDGRLQASGGAVLAGGAAVALIGGFLGFGLDYKGQKNCADQVEAIQEFHDKVKDHEKTFGRQKERLDEEKRIYDEKRSRK